MRRPWAPWRLAPRLPVFLYATLPRLASYALYRGENNIRDAGGLGQLMAFRMDLFQLAKTATALGARLLLVALSDALSHTADRGRTGLPSCCALRNSPFGRPGGLTGVPSCCALRNSPFGRPGGLMR